AKGDLGVFASSREPIWQATDVVYDRSSGARAPTPSRAIGAHEPVELELSRMLAEYTRLMKPAKGRGKLVFVHLQKRLLSSVPAFYRTLKVHAERVRAGTANAR